jgi:hypothetical protein
MIKGPGGRIGHQTAPFGKTGGCHFAVCVPVGVPVGVSVGAFVGAFVGVFVGVYVGVSMGVPFSPACLARSPNYLC